MVNYASSVSAFVFWPFRKWFKSYAVELDHMKQNNLLDPMKSTYRVGHSTETALLRIHSDINSAIDKGKVVFLTLLVLSAAFDTVGYEILLSFLKVHVGIDGPVVRLLKHILLIELSISMNGALSELSELEFGVLQGSVLIPIAFCIYTIPLDAFL